MAERPDLDPRDQILLDTLDALRKIQRSLAYQTWLLVGILVVAILVLLFMPTTAFD